jgi:hypothetical protein
MMKVEGMQRWLAEGHVWKKEKRREERKKVVI